MIPIAPERGSATVWMLGMGVLLVLMLTAVGMVGQVVIRDAQLQGTVDRAALAGADVLIGVVPGTPCDHVTELVVSEGFTPLSCSLDSQSVRVKAGASYAGLSWSRRARAGATETGHE